MIPGRNTLLVISLPLHMGERWPLFSEGRASRSAAGVPGSAGRNERYAPYLWAMGSGPCGKGGGGGSGVAIGDHKGVGLGDYRTHRPEGPVAGSRRGTVWGLSPVES